MTPNTAEKVGNSFVVVAIGLFLVAMASFGIGEHKLSVAKEDCNIRGYSDYDKQRGKCYSRVYEVEHAK